jgi:hypothetical protein
MNDTSETKVEKSEPQLVASFPKNKREEVRVRLTEWEGKPYVDVRVFFATGEGDWVGTKKGIMMNANLLPELADAIEKAGEVLAGLNK